MRCVSICLACLCLASTAIAQDEFSLIKTRSQKPNAEPQTWPITTPTTDKFEVPVLEIGGQRTVVIGETIDLWIKPLAKRPANLQSVIYTWFMLPSKTPAVWPDTTRIITGTGNKPQTFIFNITASYLFVVKEGDKTVAVEQRVTDKKIEVQVVEHAADPNQPAPTGLGKNAADWVALVTRTAVYTDAQVKVDAKRLAGSFREIASLIDKNQIAADEIVSATRTNNQKILDSHATEWVTWFQKIAETLNQNYRGATPQQLSEVWKEIAKGLEAVGQ